MAVVLRNLANELTRYARVIYFGRFGRDREFDLTTTTSPGNFFELVNVQGGVWDRELVVRILNHYKEIDYVFCEDDGFSAYGITKACEFHRKPFHFLTPIDSLPVHKAIVSDVFLACKKLYVPNSSWELFNGKKRLQYNSSVHEYAGDTLKSVFLPHGVRYDSFFPFKVDRSDKFTFLWMGRMEPRKNPRAFIEAMKIVKPHIDAIFLIRSDWRTPMGILAKDYIKKQNLPVIFDQTEDIKHEGMAHVYNKADINISTARAGGFEMSLIEAAACRVPSIVTDWTFMNENIVHEKSGILVPVEGFTNPPPPDPKEYRTSDIAKDRIWGNISVQELAKYMLWAYNNQEHIKHMGKWARSYVMENYDWRKIGRKLYEEIVE
jgi:glycosyltransferase involved in cell wall biosynthesis